jgi:photosystem II stability/assembly factor-like uncharacterized protein
MTKSSNNLIIGTKDSGIYLSNDNGNTWNQSNSGLMLNGINCLNITMLFSSNGKVFLGAKQNTTFYDFASLFVSNNNGQTWSPVTTGLGDNFNISSMTDFGQYLILGTKNEFSPAAFNDGVYLSTDSGNSWLFDGLDLPITDVAASGNEYFAISGQSVYSTQNMGNSWSEIMLGSVNYPLSNIERLNNTVIVQTTNNGVYYLNNGNWVPFGAFGILGGLNKSICQKQNGSIFIGTSSYTNANNGNITYVNNGVSKYIGTTLGLMDGAQIESINIYPNPMNSKTTLEITNDLLGLNFTLMDQFGKVLLESKIQELLTEIDLSIYSKGVYYLKLDNPTVGIKKIIKQ